ncbi:hypothetical protein DVH05_009502 [Phytophthora capsici]|nr:hypothetical protein DVH05_009502 [Phytophthora capsici]
MLKRVYHEEASSNDGAVNPSKRTKATSSCKYCSKSFTSRGLSLHQRKCSMKLAHEKKEAKKTRAYKFCILNESVHEEILSFLSNQTLTKMQLITGDHYEGCEPELAKICCKCENDNFTIGCFLCRQCAQKWPVYRFGRLLRVTKAMANKFYGVKLRDLSTLEYERSSGSCLYDRATLENFMLKSYGSKKGLLRHLVNVRARWEKAEAEKWRRKKLCDFLVIRALELVSLVKTGHYKELKVEDKDQWYPRLYDIKKACQDGGLNFLSVLESTLCKDFIENGIGSVEAVMNGIQQD